MAWRTQRFRLHRRAKPPEVRRSAGGAGCTDSASAVLTAASPREAARSTTFGGRRRLHRLGDSAFGCIAARSGTKYDVRRAAPAARARRAQYSRLHRRPKPQEVRRSAAGASARTVRAKRERPLRRRGLVGCHDRVGKGGVEPPRPFGHTDLNRARLPFRHLPEHARRRRDNSWERLARPRRAPAERTVGPAAGGRQALPDQRSHATEVPTDGRTGRTGRAVVPEEPTERPTDGWATDPGKRVMTLLERARTRTLSAQPPRSTTTAHPPRRPARAHVRTAPQPRSVFSVGLTPPVAYPPKGGNTPTEFRMLPGARTSPCEARIR